MGNLYTKEQAFEAFQAVYVDAYCRYSDHNQDEGNSIEYQVEEIEAYCTRNNMTVRKWYIDKAISGKKVAGRDSFFELLDDIKHGESSPNLLVWKTNRAFRNSYESHKYRKFLREHSITLYSVTQNIDENTSTGRLTTNILSDIDQYKAEEIAEHVVASQKLMVRNGFFIGGICPLGYKTIPADFNGKPRKKYAINEDERDIALRVFTDFLNGSGATPIIKWLNAEGILTRRGNQWDAVALRYMLRNDFYIGTRRYYAKELQEELVFENAVPAIITPEMFQAVQDKIEENKIGTSNRKRSSRTYSLTGKIFCSKDNCESVWHGKYCKPTSIYYTCGDKKRFKKCKSKNVRKDAIEKLVFQAVKDNILSDKAIERIAADVLASAKKTPSGNADKKTLEKRRSELMLDIVDLVNMKQRGSITEDIMMIMKTPKEKELREIEKQLYEIETLSKNVLDYEKIKSTINNLFDTSLAFEDVSGDILKELFDKTVEKITIDDAQITLFLRVYFTPWGRKQSSGSPVFSLRHFADRKELEKYK